MGVIYKTKEEIRAFILQEKKANSEISCRQLVPLIQEKFGVSLSKSTINSLFKEANLSGPIGRKPAKTKPKLAFKLPSEKKIAPASALLAKPEIPLPPIPLPEPIKLPDIQVGPIALPRAEFLEPPAPPVAPQKTPEPALSLPPIAEAAPEPTESVVIPEKPAASEEPEILEPLEIKENETIDGLGSFFLKAAEWELSKDSLLGGILENYLSHPERQALNLNSEILLFLEAFGLSIWKDFEQYNQKGLWAVNLAPYKRSPQDLLKFAKGLKKLRGLPMAIFNEYYKNSPEITHIKVLLEDRTVFFLDPQLRSLWQNVNLPNALFTTFYKAKGRLRKLFEENSEPVIFQTTPGYRSFSAVFSELIWSCEAIPGKSIAILSLYNHKNQEVYKTDILPVEKRYFIAGFWPWQEEGMRFINEDIRKISGIKIPEQNREIFFSENKTFLRQPRSTQKSMMRVGLIRSTGLGWPHLGVITNIPEEKMLMEEVILAYLRRWPNEEEGYQHLTKKTTRMQSMDSSYQQEIKPEKSGGLFEYSLSIHSSDMHTNLSSLMIALNNLCQRCFFPVSYENADFPTMRERFYQVPGSLERKNGFLSVTLKPPAGYSFSADLNFAVRRLNESDIEAPSDQKLVMKIA